MKRIFLLTVLLCGFGGFAQGPKAVYFMNMSAYTFCISEINTIKETPGTPPTYGYPTHTNDNTHRGGAYINVPPGGTYILDNPANPTKFPFVSTAGNIPQLTMWKKYASATSSLNVTSATAFLTASTQIFSHTKFGVLVGGSVTAGGTLFNAKVRPAGSSYLIDGTYVDYIIEEEDGQIFISIY